MADFNARSDSVNVEQIMEQIRARIRDKRGVDYTEQQIRELAAVKLEKFLDPRGVRSDLLDEFRRLRPARDAAPLANYVFDDRTLFDTHRAPIRWIRRMLLPILKLFFNPNPLIQALHIQSQLNASYVQGEASRRARDELTFEVMHNLVVETTRLGIEVKNLKMRVESMVSRLEFNERRARALESAVVYKPTDEGRMPRTMPPAQAAGPVGAPSPLPPPSGPPAGGPSASQSAGAEGPGQRSRRRRRRRGRRSGAPPAATLMGGGQPPAQTGTGDEVSASEAGYSHAATAETIEQSVATESHPSEEHQRPDPDPGDFQDQ